MLKPHYRSDVAIRPRGPAGQAVEVHSYTDEAGLAMRLGKVLQRLLLVDKLLARDIVVLTPGLLARIPSYSASACPTASA